MHITTRIAIAIFGFGFIPGLATSALAQTVRVWGGDGSGQVSQAPQGDFRAIGQGGATQSIAIREDKTLVLWGGVGDLSAVPAIPANLVDERFKSVVIGRTHVVAIRNDGTLAVWGLARPAFGESHLAVPEGHFAAVAAGNRHSVGLGVNGTLQAWGSNDAQQLAVPDGKFREVSSRVQYSIAIRRQDGALVGWGTSPVFAGWLQIPGDPYRFFVLDERFEAVAAGNIHALAIRADDGRVVGWGVAAGGALNAPDREFTKIAAGFGFSVGIDVDGTLWGWGTPTAPPPPLPSYPWSFESAGWTRYGDSNHYYVPDERFEDIAAAAFHVVALTAGKPVTRQVALRFRLTGSEAALATLGRAVSSGQRRD